MLPAKHKRSISFDPNGRRLDASCSKSILFRPTKPVPAIGSSTTETSIKPPNKLTKSRAFIQRAPILNGLSVSTGLCKKFQRPMTKRRAYDNRAELALRQCSLGQRKRNGMENIWKRAGKGLMFRLPEKFFFNNNIRGKEEEADNKTLLEPLCVWKSPWNGGDTKGLPDVMMKELSVEQYGIKVENIVRRPAPMSAYTKEDQFVPSILIKWLRPHQREGLLFMYECVMGMRGFEGNGCILADDMGLGKTLQSVALIYTLLKTSIHSNQIPTCRRVIIVTPCSLVKNWDNEFRKWLGDGSVKTISLAESDRSAIERSIDLFVRTKMFNVLIVSYETLRMHVGRLNTNPDVCDLLVCDEAHRLKNNENQTSQSLASLPAKRRVLLTGTPMQNDLQEFFSMVDFANPGVLGSQDEFRRNFLQPVLRGREPDSTESQKCKMQHIQNEMSKLVNEFILRRVNTLNAQHLPPKLVQVVCCNLTDIQQNMYKHFVSSKDLQHILEGKQVNCLSSIQMLMKLCNHPQLVADDDPTFFDGVKRRRAGAKRICYNDEEKCHATPGAAGISKYLPVDHTGDYNRSNSPVRPEWSGKMFVLFRLMKEMRKPGNGGDKIVIVSNYTQTLDLIGKLCQQNNWGFCRLDGSITMKKRQKMVDQFNNSCSNLVVFLLSSKAGGCGLNLIGANRLILFDPDWNPAVDKQAAARCWRDGQTKRCFIYRFLTTGSVEEKIFQRQLSKAGLQAVVDDKEQINALSTKDLRNLFKLRLGTPSDTHDKLKCIRCKTTVDTASDEEESTRRILPKQLAACQELLNMILLHKDSEFFQNPILPENHGVDSKIYCKVVKQPIDFGTIQVKLQNKSYKRPWDFSKDVNRIFSNVIKVWEPGHNISDAAHRLHSFWTEQWSELAPKLIRMKEENGNNKNEGPTKKIGNDKYSHILNANTLINNLNNKVFQEQIGMPDEEDMRNWSHHYSIDSVDDPVFRSAMRGYDTVSFVFALKVSWSLIQERQKGEEKSMLNLQEFQHFGGNNDKKEGVSNDVDDERECTGKKPHGHIDSNTAEILQVVTDNESLSKSSLIERINSNIMNDGECLRLYKTLNVPYKSLESKSSCNIPFSVIGNQLQKHFKPITSDQDLLDERNQYSKINRQDSCHRNDEARDNKEGNFKHQEEGNTMYINDGIINSFKKTTITLDISTGWECSLCTFYNQKVSRKCEMCGKKEKFPQKDIAENVE